MNPLTYLTCEHCRQEFPFTEEDRYYQPILVDLHLRLHLECCEAVAAMDDVMHAEVERWLKETAL